MRNTELYVHMNKMFLCMYIVHDFVESCLATTT